MNVKGLTAAFAIAAILVSTPAVAADSGGARGFVSWIYSHYPTAARGHGFNPLGPAMARIFHPSLIDLIKQGHGRPGDGIPALDGDPLCDCQADDDMTFTIASVRSSEFSRATATIVRHEIGGTPEVENIVLDLAMTNGGWRVYDIQTTGTPSLRAFLIESNREQAEP